jgi:hypothetical protein
VAHGVFGDLAVDYGSRSADGHPKAWTVYSLADRVPAVRLEIDVDHGVWNQPVEAAAFALDVAGKAPMSLEDLRESGPLRRRR